jgi:hypothetical protein
MKRVYYSGGSVLTGDRTADAVVRYAGALATRAASDTIDIPISLTDGSVGRAQLLIGPASQFVVVPEEHALAGPEDNKTIAELSKRTVALASPRPQPVDTQVSPDYADDSDYSDAPGLPEA